MKKESLFAWVIVMMTVFFYGCHSHHLSNCSVPGSQPAKSGGYPVGHDMHPDTSDEQKNAPNPLQGYS